jgi:hypothetical protein
MTVRRSQREQWVQELALEWIAERHAGPKPKRRVCLTKEAAVERSKRYWGRADGVVVVQQPEGEVHTIALEAKSMRTRDALHAQEGCGKMFALTTFAWVATSLLLAWWLVAYVGRVAGFISGVAVGLVVALLLLRWITDATVFSTHAVIKQVQRYPAAERWIAIPKDFETRHGASCNRLKEACAKAHRLGGCRSPPLRRRRSTPHQGARRSGGSSRPG